MIRSSVMRRISLFALLTLAVPAVTVSVRPAVADAFDMCAKVRQEDRLRAYDPAMRPGFVRAFRRLFPEVRGGQSEALLRAEAVFRCMDGRLIACFRGANLPCGKLETSRLNVGANAFCAANPGAPVVPAVASGHAAAFLYRCQAGNAVVSGTAHPVDARGFAKDLWAPLDLE